MLDRWSIAVSDIDPDPIRRAASSDGLEVKVAVKLKSGAFSNGI